MPRKAAPSKTESTAKPADASDRDASDEEFRRAYDAEKPRWVDLADRLK